MANRTRSEKPKSAKHLGNLGRANYQSGISHRAALRFNGLKVGDSPVRLLCHLTERQKEILRMIAEEETTIGMALALHVSPKTVEYHRQKLMESARIFNTIGLTKLAIWLGLVENPAGWKTWKQA